MLKYCGSGITTGQFGGPPGRGGGCVGDNTMLSITSSNTRREAAGYIIRSSVCFAV
jgi:hypothetical protein